MFGELCQSLNDLKHSKSRIVVPCASLRSVIYLNILYLSYQRKMDPSGRPCGATKPAWILRSRGTDGLLYDHFETTRFKRRSTFDVLNLSPGTYDLFIGIRRDNFFFEESWGSKKNNNHDDQTASITSSDRRKSLDEDSEEDQIQVEGAESEESGRTETRVMKHLRHGIGAAFISGRKVISTVTMGKVGSLALLLDVTVINGQGMEIASASEHLTPGDRANFEMRFTVVDHETTIKLKIKSLSTIHTLYVYASVFPVGEDDGELASSPREITEEEQIAIEDETIQQLTEKVLVYDKPTQMLRRAITGSRNPERSAFARALAFACFSSLFGFIVGFTMDAGTSIPLAGFAYTAWLARAVVHILVISFQ